MGWRPQFALAALLLGAAGPTWAIPTTPGTAYFFEEFATTDPDEPGVREGRLRQITRGFPNAPGTGEFSDGDYEYIVSPDGRTLSLDESLFINQFFAPTPRVRDIVFTPDGQLYGAHEDDIYRIELSPTNVVTTLVAAGASGGEPSEIFSAPNGLVYQTLANDPFVYEVDIDAGTITALGDPGGTVGGIDTQNNLLVYDAPSGAIYRVDPTDLSQTLLGIVTQVAGAEALVIADTGKGTLLIGSDRGRDVQEAELVRLDLDTGAIRVLTDDRYSIKEIIVFVPEPGSGALLALGLAAVAAWRRR